MIDISGKEETQSERNQRIKKRKKVYVETYVKNTFMSDKKRLCEWIMQDDVCIRVSNGGELDDGTEFTVISIEGFNPKK